MKPINKYIIITPAQEELKTKSGLLLSQTDAFAFRYKKATVVKPGTEVSTIKEGDVILLRQGTSTRGNHQRSVVCSHSRAGRCGCFIDLFSSSIALR